MWELEKEQEKKYLINIKNFIKKERLSKKIYPSDDLIYNAFNLCKYKNLKVVIIGQDPYHNEGQAHGLSFSVLYPNKLPPSLKNIYKEIEMEYNVKITKNKGDLTNWALQGVLLLNTSLTVEHNKPSSHSKIGWINFTKNIIEKINNEKENIVFLLWGNHAKQFESIINKEKHLVLKSAHPSPFSAKKGFFGNNHFIKTNSYLKIKNIKEIDWLNI